MSAEITNEYSMKVFTTLSMIMAGHHCYMKDIDMDTGIFTIGGRSERDIEKCENTIYDSFANFQNQMWGGV